MSTILIPICNHNISFANIDEAARHILQGLQLLNFEKAFHVNAHNQILQETGEWNYEILKEEEDAPLRIEFGGPFAYFPTVYEQCAEIGTIYRYSLIYKNYMLDWFQQFRRNIFQIVRLLGGSEVIYLADNNNKLAEYYEGMVIEGVAYDNIKNLLIQEFGNPVTNFKELDYASLEYSALKEFFLDEFLDFK